MKSISLEFPSQIHLDKPYDFARNFPGEGISIAEVTESSDLEVSWDESRICFATRGVAVTYDRTKIIKFLIDRDARVSRWLVCHFEVELKRGSIAPIIYTDKSNEPIFNAFLTSLLATELGQVFQLSSAAST